MTESLRGKLYNFTEAFRAKYLRTRKTCDQKL